jgi:hypothetical protein
MGLDAVGYGSNQRSNLMSYPDPAAVLVSVDGTPEGDYMVAFRGDMFPFRGGESPLVQWQVDDLLERGYQFAV